MPTITYFDGSGISASNRVLALAAITGSAEVWAEFNALWAQALDAAGIPAPWHTTEFLSGKKSSRREIPKGLLNILGRAPARELKVVSIAIDKIAAQELRDRPELQVPSDAEICVNLCFREIGIAQADAGKGDCLSLLFDREEPFIKHLKKPWQAERRRSKRLREGWPWQTYEIEPVTAAEHPGIQAADLVAWAVRSTYEYGDRYADPNGFPVFVHLLLTGKHLGGFLNREKLAGLFLRGGNVELGHTYSFMEPEPNVNLSDDGVLDERPMGFSDQARSVAAETEQKELVLSESDFL